jgi:hypothetical protein
MYIWTCALKEGNGGRETIACGKDLKVRTPVVVRASIIVGVMNSVSSLRCLLPTAWGELIVARKDAATWRCGETEEAIAAATFCDKGPVPGQEGNV